MKTLILIRHGKSSWEHDLPDKKRPLKTRGINDAHLVSNEFKTRLIRQDLVLSSPAVRAFSTCEIFRKNLKISDVSVKVNEDLYDFQGEKLIKVIKNLDNNYDNVMIFGHNHAFTSICNIFGNRFIENLPTTGLAVIQFDCKSWQDIKNGQTIATIFPKDLK